MSHHLVLILGGLLVIQVIFFLVFWFQLRSKKPENEAQHFLVLGQRFDALMQSVNAQLFQFSKTIDDRLNVSSQVSAEAGRQFNERLDNAGRFWGELQKDLNFRLGQLGEANEKIFAVGKDLVALEQILRHPKMRGGFGEHLLEMLLSEMLPRDCFELQYTFKTNDKVDAVIKLGEQLICIDSKFPLENFRRMMEATEEKNKSLAKRTFSGDVKKHIDSISKKYILPEESTLDFAFMYIPAENVYYEVIVRDDQNSEAESLHRYALSKRVIPVSPNSFYAYLGALMIALKGQKVQKDFLHMTTFLRQMVTDLEKFRSEFEKMGFHLGHLSSSYQTAEKRLGRVEDRLDRMGEDQGLVLQPETPESNLIDIPKH